MVQEQLCSLTFRVWGYDGLLVLCLSCNALALQGVMQKAAKVWEEPCALPSKNGTKLSKHITPNPISEAAGLTGTKHPAHYPCPHHLRQVKLE